MKLFGIRKVQHGHWIKIDYFNARNIKIYTFIECSACGEMFIPQQRVQDYNYCPKCGTKMDKKIEEHIDGYCPQKEEENET